MSLGPRMYKFRALTHVLRMKISCLSMYSEMVRNNGRRDNLKRE